MTAAERAKQAKALVDLIDSKPAVAAHYIVLSHDEAAQIKAALQAIAEVRKPPRRETRSTDNRPDRLAVSA